MGSSERAGFPEGCTAARVAQSSSEGGGVRTELYLTARSGANLDQCVTMPSFDALI